VTSYRSCVIDAIFSRPIAAHLEKPMTGIEGIDVIDLNAFRNETFSRPTRTISRPRAGLITMRAASSLHRVFPALAWWF